LTYSQTLLLIDNKLEIPAINKAKAGFNEKIGGFIG